MRSPANPARGDGTERPGHRAAALALTQQEPKRATQAARDAVRDMKMLEDLRKLRRDRAEIAMREARAAVSAAEQLVAKQRDGTAILFEHYRYAQAATTKAVDAGGRSLDDIRKLLSKVDRSRRAAHEAQSLVAGLQREQFAAEQAAQEAMRLTQQAAAAYEKVIEWKKSA
jgi:hypothetical protein